MILLVSRVIVDVYSNLTDLKHDIVEPKSGKTEREGPAVTVQNLFRKIRLRGRNL